MLTEEQILSIIDALKVKILERGQENQDLLSFFEEKIQSIILNGIMQKDKLSEEDTQNIISLFPDELFKSKDSEALENLSSIFQRHATQDTHVKRNIETLKKTEEKLQYLLVECSRNIFLAQAKKESACLALSPEADFKFISLSADPFQFTAFKKSIQNLEKKLSDNSYYKSELEQALSQCIPSILIVENKETQKKCQKKLRLLMQELLRGTQDILPIIKCLSQENASWLSQLATSEQFTLKEFQKRWLLQQYHPDFDERSELSAFTQHFLDNMVPDTTYRAAATIEETIKLKQQEDMPATKNLKKTLNKRDYEFKRLDIIPVDTDNPKHWLCYHLGDEVNCCLRAGGDAQQSIIDGLTQPTSGFYVVTEKKSKGDAKEKICAAIYAFISQKGNLILDSIEPLSASGKSEYADIVRDLIMEFAATVVQDAQGGHPIQRVCLGTGGNTELCFNQDALRNKELRIGYEEPQIGTVQYPDSAHVIVLAHNAAEEARLQKLINTLVGDPKESQTEDINQLRMIVRELLLTHCSRLFYEYQVTDIDNYIAALRYAGLKDSFEKKQVCSTAEGLLNLKVFYKEAFALMLLWVCQNKNTDFIDFFLKKQVAINTINADGQTALCVACKNGYADIVKTLLTKGAHVNHQDYKKDTPLFWAFKKGHTQIVNELIAAGANVNLANNNGDTPLSFAAMRGRIDDVKALLAVGAKVNNRNQHGDTLLSLLAGQGRLDLVTALLEAGAHVNTQNQHGYTPLFWASLNGHTSVVKTLLEAGAHINTRNKYGYTPLFCAAAQGHTEIVITLIQASANINLTNNNGYTPLFWAAQNDHADIVGILLRAGAEIDASLRQNATIQRELKKIPLNENTYQYIDVTGLPKGGIDIQEHPHAFFKVAASCKKESTIDLIFNQTHDRVSSSTNPYEESISRQDSDGKTALHHALEAKNIVIARYLIKHYGASLTIKDNLGNTPLEYVDTQTQKELQVLVPQSNWLLDSLRAFFFSKSKPIGNDKNYNKGPNL